MSEVEKGKYVQVHYKGTLENGDVFDSSEGRDPLEFIMGQGQVVPGFENAFSGMSVAEKKTFTLEPDQAYGPRDENRVTSFDRAQIPQDANPKVGDTVGLTNDQGQQIPAMVTEVTEEKVSVDWNHPLAGQRLTFEIEVMGVTDKPTQAAPAGCGENPSGACGDGCCNDTPGDGGCSGCG